MNSSFVNQWTVTTGSGGELCVYNEVQAEVVIQDGNIIRSLSTSDGSTIWSFNIGSTIGFIAITPGGNVLVSAAEGVLYDGAGTRKSVFLLSGADGSLLASFTGGVPNTSEFLHASVNSRNEICIVDPNATCVGQDAGGEISVYYCDGGLNVIKSWVSDAKPAPYARNEMWAMWDPDHNIIVIGDKGYAVSYKRDGTVNWERALMPLGQEITAASVDNDGIVHLLQSSSNAWNDTTTNFQLLGIFATTGGVKYSAIAASRPESAMMGSTGRDEVIATRNTRLAAVAGGSIYLIKNGEVALATSGASALTTGAYDVQSANAFSKIYYIDGTNLKKLTLSSDTVSAWNPSDIPALPRLIARYRGRIVLAGQVADPNNWHMSKSGDPDNWDTAPAVTNALMAVSGNIGEQGLMGDVVTALIPYDDDAMVIGMDSSIAIMAGDPAAGGAIDVVSNDTGIAWGAWALDPYDTLYFMGIDGIYKMPRGGQIVSLTLNVLDDVFEKIDLSVNRVVLEWDYRRRGLLVIIANVNDDTINDAFFFDARTEGWFPTEYPVTMGPNVIISHDAELADDKQFLLGCRDGYIRQIDEDALDDDGTTIASNVRLFPVSTRTGTDSRLAGLEIVLVEGSKDVTLKLYSGQTAEQVALSTTVRWSRTLKAGRNVLTLPRIAGAWLQMEFTATTRWGLESLYGLFDEKGRSRRLKQ